MFFRGRLALFLSFVFWTPYLIKKNIEKHFFKGLKYFLILLYLIYDFLTNVLSGSCVTCSGRTQCAGADNEGSRSHLTLKALFYLSLTDTATQSFARCTVLSDVFHLNIP